MYENIFDLSLGNAALWLAFLLLAFAAVCRAFGCESAFRTWPWQLCCDNKKLKRFCQILLVAALFLITVYASLDDMFGVNLFVIVAGICATSVLAVIWLYLFQAVAVAVASFFYLFYMIGCYFFKK